MPVPAILRGAAAALLFSLATIPAASAAHRAGHGGPFYGAPAPRMHAGPHRAGIMRPALHHRHHGHRPGIHRGGHDYGHHGFQGARHHAGKAFFHRGGHRGFRHEHGLRHHGPRFHAPAYGYSPRKRFFRAHGYGLGGYGLGGYGLGGYARPAYDDGPTYARPVYGASHGYYPTLAYGTVAGAAPYGPLYNRPAGACY
jgi:hypothetical protein